MKGSKRFLLWLLILCLILTPGMVTSADSTTSEKKLVAHYKFDGDFLDASGNGNNGTLFGDVTFVDGLNGKGASFAGGYVEVKHSESLNLTSGFTFSAWTYRLNTKEQLFSPILSKKTVTGKTTDAYAFLTNQDKIAVRAWINSGLGLYTSASWVDIGKWSLMTVTADTQGLKYYLDGKFVENISKTVAFPASTGVLHIGTEATAFGSTYFKGILDDLKIYNYAVTPDEVKAEYTAMAEATGKYLLNRPTGLVAYYPFNDTLLDASGYGNHGEAIAAEGGISYGEGVSGKGATFDGASYITVKDSDSLDLDKGMTLSVWLKIKKNTSLETKFQPILDKLDGNSFIWGDSPAYRIFLGFDKPGFNYHMSGKDARTTDRTLFAKVVPTDRWALLTVTTDGNVTKMYVDGALVETQTEKVFMPHSMGDLLIGTYTHLGKSEFFNGTMDELRLYNYGMTANEVKDLLNKRQQLKISVDNPTLKKSTKQIKVELTGYQYTAPAPEANSGTHVIVLSKPVETYSTKDVTDAVTYESSNKKVMTVSSSGVIKAVGKGNATITVTYEGGITGTKTFKVK